MDIGMIAEGINEFFSTSQTLADSANMIPYMVDQAADYAVQYGHQLNEFANNLGTVLKNAAANPAGRVVLANTANVLLNIFTKYLQKTEDENHKEKHIAKTYLVTGLITLMDLLASYSDTDSANSAATLIEPAFTAATTFPLTYLVQRKNPI